MPKELKKRQRGGRSKKKNNDSDQQAPLEGEIKTQRNDAEFLEQDFVSLNDVEKPSAGPSGTLATSALAPPPAFGQNEIDPAAPFGFVDPDVKAYFRSVDERLREWEGLGLVDVEDEESELEGEPTLCHIKPLPYTLSETPHLIQTGRAFCTQVYRNCDLWNSSCRRIRIALSLWRGCCTPWVTGDEEWLPTPLLASMCWLPPQLTVKRFLTLASAAGTF